MELEKEWKMRLYALNPDMRLRIENYANYDNDTSIITKEIFYSELAMELIDELRGEAEIFFWTMRGREKRLDIGFDLSFLNDSELDHIGQIALQYMRNPSGVKNVEIYNGDAGDEV